MRRFVITFCVLAVLSGRADSCSCATLPTDLEGLKELYDWADLVALVRADESVIREWNEAGTTRQDWFVRVVVVESFKGTEDGVDVYIEKTPTGSTCDPHFYIRNTYLVFASGPTANGRYTTGLCVARLFSNYDGSPQIMSEALKSQMVSRVTLLRQISR